MKFTIAVHGTRGDVEPAAAVARELWRRGHKITMAVPPNLIGFASAAGPFSVTAFGPDSQKQLETAVFRDWWNVRNPISVLRQIREYAMDGWSEMSATLAAIAKGSDLILSGTTYQELAANVSESLNVPLASLHYFPLRANQHLLPFRLPIGLISPAWAAMEWAHWRLLKPADDAQRHNLGLPKSRVRASRRIVEQGALEIQAYDKLFFPGLDEDWGYKRPLVGAMSLQQDTSSDESVLAWIDAGTPPIYFGFGSMPIEHPEKTLAMIAKVCRELGERALVCADILDFAGEVNSERIHLIRSVNHSKIFPHCRAVVHHGGAGTTAASIRAGVPTLILWISAEQPIWAARVHRLGVGKSRRFSLTTEKTLREDLQITMGQACTVTARRVAMQMTPVSESLRRTADLLEQHAGSGTRRQLAG